MIEIVEVSASLEPGAALEQQAAAWKEFILHPPQGGPLDDDFRDYAWGRQVAAERGVKLAAQLARDPVSVGAHPGSRKVDPVEDFIARRSRHANPVGRELVAAYRDRRISREDVEAIMRWEDAEWAIVKLDREVRDAPPAVALGDIWAREQLLQHIDARRSANSQEVEGAGLKAGPGQTRRIAIKKILIRLGALREGSNKVPQYIRIRGRKAAMRAHVRETVFRESEHLFPGDKGPQVRAFNNAWDSLFNPVRGELKQVDGEHVPPPGVCD